ncbi:MAG: hypothetical protein LBD23_17575 [Oscillospiraceae bacterium]|jgi:hypothetical protein|nr:hypothetical protein [Oscillospiraceae bacterium]
MDVKLKAGNASLRFEKVNKNQWYRLYLITYKETFLGADVLLNIKEKIINYLTGVTVKEKPVYEYNGFPIVGVMTLAETHVTWYGTIPKDDSDFIIFIQDCKAHFFAEIRLSKSDADMLVKELEELKG